MQNFINSIIHNIPNGIRKSDGNSRSTKGSFARSPRASTKGERAEERMADLRKNLSVVKGELSSATTVEELYRVCAGFVSKVNNARQILGNTKKAKVGKKQSK